MSIFKAPDIAVMLMDALLVYDLGDDFESLVTIALHEWLIQNTAYHVVNWPGGFRFVVGILFSGDYNTSDLNTRHLIFIGACYCVHVYKKTGELKYLSALRDGAFVNVVQGDDIIGSMASESYYPHISPSDFKNYLKETWRMIVKPEAFRESTSLFCEVDISGFVTTPIENQIVFLKRVLIWQDGKIRPFRPLLDVIYRIYRSTSNVTSVYDILAKLVGLGLDTLGVNRIAWVFCFNAVTALINAELDHPDSLDYKLPNDERVFRYQHLFDAMKGEKYLNERAYKMGIVGASPEQLYSLSRDRLVLLDLLDGNPDKETEYLHQQSLVGRNVPAALY